MVTTSTPEDLDDVARLFAGFRDWFGKDEPSDGTIRSRASRLLEDL